MRAPTGDDDDLDRAPVVAYVASASVQQARGGRVMAVLKQGILGGGRNAVGTVVMSNWKGKDVIRARVSPSNPNTQAQQATRALFRGLVTLATYIMDSFIRP